MSFERLTHRLLNGYRMGKPQYATNEIDQLMADCWNAEPSLRPSFRELEEMLSSQLEASVPEDFLSLDDDDVFIPTDQARDKHGDSYC